MDLPNPGIEPRSPALRADSFPPEPQGKPKYRVGTPQILVFSLLLSHVSREAVSGLLSTCLLQLLSCKMKRFLLLYSLWILFSPSTSSAYFHHITFALSTLRELSVFPEILVPFLRMQRICIYLFVLTAFSLPLWLVHLCISLRGLLMVVPNNYIVSKKCIQLCEMLIWCKV